MKASELLIVACILALLAAIAVSWVDAYECQESGGTVVRGLFWLECIDAGR